jgi:hypothetical protein
VKPTVTLRSPFSGTVITQVVPVHDPLNPVKVDPLPGDAISVTVDPTGKIARQIPDLTPFVMVHATPPGELETDPLPVPLPTLTVTDPGTANRYSACTARDWESVT